MAVPEYTKVAQELYLSYFGRPSEIQYQIEPDCQPGPNEFIEQRLERSRSGSTTKVRKSDNRKKSKAARKARKRNKK